MVIGFLQLDNDGKTPLPDDDESEESIKKSRHVEIHEGKEPSVKSVASPV